MSITRRLSALIAVSALTVMTPGHAETPTQEGQPTVVNQMYRSATDSLQGLVERLIVPIILVNPKEVTCLAKNIFFEAGNEPEEGKVAVGLVTINRSQDPRFPNSVCGVINQKVTRDISKQGIIKTKTFWGTKIEIQTIWSKLTICQFSWRCMFVKTPKSHDESWIESQRVATELLASQESYEPWREKYSDALYFHATGVRPGWSHQKQVVNRIGGHYFYADRQ